MKIKKNVIILSTILTMAFTTAVMAGQVGSITTFSSGTPAVAAEVNGNFTSVETAVNDNDNKISINTSNITTNQSRLSTLEAGLVSINSVAFSTHSTDTNCTPVNNGSGLSMSAGVSCISYASIQLPNSTRITQLSCTLLENDSGTDRFVEGTLERANVSDGGSEIPLFITSSVVDTVPQVITSTSLVFADTDIVDNSTYFYRLKARFGAVASANVSIIGCTVSYAKI